MGIRRMVFPAVLSRWISSYRRVAPPTTPYNEVSDAAIASLIACFDNGDVRELNVSALTLRYMLCGLSVWHGGGFVDLRPGFGMFDIPQ